MLLAETSNRSVVQDQVNTKIGDGTFGLWEQSLKILSEIESEGGHLGTYLDGEGKRVRRVRQILVPAFRYWLGAEWLWKDSLERQPRRKVEGILRLAISQLAVASPEARPAVVDFAVEFSRTRKLSRGESNFLNAILRKMAERVNQLHSIEGARQCHPKWLIRRWDQQFGSEATGELALWNQRKPELYFLAPAGDGGESTAWPNYRKASASIWPEVRQRGKSGEIYIQDPFARIPVDFIVEAMGRHSDPKILDLCSSPGGKTYGLLYRLSPPARILSVDLPKRMDRLVENWSRWPRRRRVQLMGTDLLRLAEFPSMAADAVLVDVPCSNTGVIQRKPDVRLRLGPESIAHQACLQLELLIAAGRLVRPEGFLVYSTCSLEAEENEEVAHAFLEHNPRFTLIKKSRSFPWIHGHDGGGAFLFQFVQGRE